MDIDLPALSAQFGQLLLNEPEPGIFAGQLEHLRRLLRQRQALAQRRPEAQLFKLSAQCLFGLRVACDQLQLVADQMADTFAVAFAMDTRVPIEKRQAGAVLMVADHALVTRLVVDCQMTAETEQRYGRQVVDQPFIARRQRRAHLPGPLCRSAARQVSRLWAGYRCEVLIVASFRSAARGCHGRCRSAGQGSGEPAASGARW